MTILPTGPLSRSMSRTLALALLALGAILLVFGVIDPLLAMKRDYGAAIERSQRLLDGYRTRQADVRSLTAELASLRSDQPSKRTYLVATNATLAGAQLQSHLKTVVEAAGGELVTTQIIERQNAGGSPQITVRAQMTGSIGALRQIFHRLESEHPLLFIDNVTIHAPDAPNAVADPMRGRMVGTGADRLSVGYDIYGYLWRGEKS